jgi:hypothetical protein
MGMHFSITVSNKATRVLCKYILIEENLGYRVRSESPPFCQDLHYYTKIVQRVKFQRSTSSLN